MDKKNQYCFIYWNTNPKTLERYRDVKIIYALDVSKAFLDKGFHHEFLIALCVVKPPNFEFYEFEFIQENKFISGFNLIPINFACKTIKEMHYTTLVYNKLKEL